MNDQSESVKSIQNEVRLFAAELNQQIRIFRKTTGIPVMIYVTEPSQESLGSVSTQEILVRAII